MSVTAVHVRVSRAVPWLAIVGAFALSVRSYRVYPSTFGDIPTYLSMARSPFGEHPAPFAYRIGQPWVVYGMAQLFGADTSAVYACTTYACTLATALLLAHWLTLRGVGVRLAGALACVYLLTFPGAFSIAGWGLVDAAFHLTLVLGLVLVEVSGWWAFAVLLIVGCAVKENTGLLVPYAAMHLWVKQQVTARNLTALAVAVLGFVASFVMVRSNLVHAGTNGLANHVSIYSEAYFQHVWEYWGGAAAAVSKVFSVFTCLWIYVASGIIKVDRSDWAVAAIVPLAALQLPFATDIERMVAAAFPAVCLLVARELADAPAAEAVGAASAAIVLYATFQRGGPYGDLVLLTLVLAVSARALALWRRDSIPALLGGRRTSLVPDGPAAGTKR